MVPSAPSATVIQKKPLKTVALLLLLGLFRAACIAGKYLPRLMAALGGKRTLADAKSRVVFDQSGAWLLLEHERLEILGRNSMQAQICLVYEPEAAIISGLSEDDASS
jgi:hypothetical protein